MFALKVREANENRLEEETNQKVRFLMKFLLRGC